MRISNLEETDGKSHLVTKNSDIAIIKITDLMCTVLFFWKNHGGNNIIALFVFVRISNLEETDGKSHLVTKNSDIAKIKITDLMCTVLFFWKNHGGNNIIALLVFVRISNLEETDGKSHLVTKNSDIAKIKITDLMCTVLFFWKNHGGNNIIALLVFVRISNLKETDGKSHLVTKNSDIAKIKITDLMCTVLFFWKNHGGNNIIALLVFVRISNLKETDGKSHLVTKNSDIAKIKITDLMCTVLFF